MYLNITTLNLWATERLMLETINSVVDPEPDPYSGAL